MRILLAEGDPLLRRFIQRALQVLGHEVAAVEGARALSRESFEALDLVLCAARLPDADGIDVCRWFKSSRPSLRILFLAGDPDAAERAREAALGRVLTKPFRFHELAQALSEIDILAP